MFYVFLSQTINLFIREVIFEGWQEDVLCRYLIRLVVLLEHLDLVIHEASLAVLADVVLNRIVYLPQGLLLIPALIVILIYDSLYVLEALYLPLMYFAAQLAARTLRSVVLRLLHGR